MGQVLSSIWKYLGYGTTTTTTTITPLLKKDQQNHHYITIPDTETEQVVSSSNPENAVPCFVVDSGNAVVQKAEEDCKIIQIQEIVENKLVVKEKKEINKGYGTTTSSSRHHYITIPNTETEHEVSSSNPENVPYVVVDLGNVKEIDSEKLIQVVEEITVVEKEISKKEESGSSNSSRSIKWINGEYSSMHSILLVGEGDFSFSASLAVAFGSASNIVATSLDSHEYLIQSYKFFMNNKKKIESRGGLVMHGVNARRMSKDALLSTVKVDRIIFNFPHTGDFGRTEFDLRKNKELVRGFLRSAKRMIVTDGEIHIRHKTNGYFHLWDIANIGSDEGLFLIQNPVFYRNKYPGYHTKFGFRGNKDFDCTPSRTYKFGLRPNSKVTNRKLDSFTRVCN